MNKTPLLTLALTLLLVVVFAGTTEAQFFSGKSTLSLDSKIEMMGVDISDKYVVINYKIPYNGMVEISLFDKEGEKVWANQYPNNSGENRIALKLAAFKQGTTYAYTLNYKTDQVKETLIIPATTSNKFGYGTTYQEYPLN